MQPTFDEFIGLVDHPMLVVTTTARQRHAGCLVGFHSQCSIEPPLYAVWLSKANRTFRIAVHAEVFALHFLEESDHDLAELFGTHTGDDEDKFTQCTWESGPDTVRLLQCRARIIAQRIAMYDSGGDHVCFVLSPRATTGPADFTPLLFSSVEDLDAGHDATDVPRPT
jgi:flavin reductase (DIM6/NTAB) family NADH-FMN oxidoreductase RutF